MIKKKAVKVVELDKQVVGGDKERLGIKTENDGWFTVFVLDYDGNPTPGVDPLMKATLPINVNLEYKEAPNPKNADYPYKNVIAVEHLDPNSEFKLGKDISNEALDKRIGILEDILLSQN